MVGVLKIACTPIGNLGDITRRVIDELKNCSIILVENIHHSQKLFCAIGISLKYKKIISCNKHNEKSRSSIVLKLLESNNIILISNAGAPTISDPGNKIVQIVIEHGFKIEILPGASAVTAALMGAGLNINRYIFLGFLPRKGHARKCLVKNASKLGFALVIFESALRVKKTIDDLSEWCGSKKVVIAREITKKYESFHRGVLGIKLNPKFIVKGEVVIIIECNNEKKINKEISMNDIYEKALDLITLKKQKSKEIAKNLKLNYGISSKEAYKIVIDIKNNK